MRTAILVDGGFYRKRVNQICGMKSPTERAEELFRYCLRHLHNGRNSDAQSELYRIFYYDCPPLDGFIYDPLQKKNVNLEKTETFKWTNDFFTELSRKRKVAIRKGVLLQHERGYCFTRAATKDILSGKLPLSDVENSHLMPVFQQKGVDIKIGIDIIHLAYRKLVDQIILITGDSDFVPAAKMARVEGVDVVLDSIGARITDNLSEHVDGIHSHWKSLTGHSSELE